MENQNKRIWKREIEITLTSSKLKKKKILKNGLYINVTGKKYLSSLKDEFKIDIYNLTYKELIQIINGEYYDIEIKAGYESSIHSIFKGGILSISNDFGEGKTNVVTILCASTIVAKFGQKKLNLTINSGVNIYSAINFICKRAGVNNLYIDEDFKNQTLKQIESANANITSWLDIFSNNNDYFVQSDSTGKTDVSIWSPYRKDKRFIKLNNKLITLTHGFPNLTSEGLEFYILPTFNFMPGDTIQLDKSIINITIQSKNEVYENKGFYFDESGKYMIYTLEYNLSNRDSTFEVKVNCKARNLITKLIGERQ